MKFTEEDIEKKLNFLEIEEERMQFYGYELNKGEHTYFLIGDAIFDGETYKDFKIEIKLLENINIKNAKEILDLDWEWYDFKFD